MIAVSRKIFGLILLLALSIAILSCAEVDRDSAINVNSENKQLPESNVNKFDISEFEKNRDLWTSKNIYDYRMIIGAQGFITNFPEAVLVEISDKKVKSIKSLSDKGRDAIETYEGFDSVENLFEFLKDEYDRKAEKIEVIYDSELGYPRTLFIDRTQGTDYEIKLEVKELKIVTK